MIARLRTEQGFAVATAMILMGVMISIGLAVAASADSQTSSSRVQRERESSLNLAEAVIGAQVFELSKSWPSSALAPGGNCSSTVAGAGCPSPETMTKSFSSVDYAAGSSWATSVRDNGGQAGHFYNDAITASQPAYDASGPDGRPDGRLWARAEAIVRGRKRVVVTMVRAGEVTRPFPRNVITAGWLSVTPNGLKTLIDTNGATDLWEPSPVEVRCSEPAPSTGCLNLDPSRQQVDPPTLTNDPQQGPAMTAQTLAELRTRAQSNGTYYASTTGCPLEGQVVYIKSGPVSCNSTIVYNGPPKSPGVVIVECGTISFGGTLKYYGLVYAANCPGGTPSTGKVVDINGNAQIHGAVTVDGPGAIEIGSSGVNLYYDQSVFEGVRGYGNATPIQGTWREVPPNG